MGVSFPLVDVAERQKRIIVIAVLLSVILHGLWILGLNFLSHWKSRTAVTPQDEVIVYLPPPKAQEKRIVESTKGQKVDKAKDDAYLGEANRVVEQETIGKDSGILNQPRPAQKKSSEVQQTAKAQTGPLSKFGIGILPPVLAKPAAPEERDNWAKQEESPAPFNDYIKGLKQAESTALNTKEFMFFGYYQRIRQRLDMAWRPFLREEIMKIVRQGRGLASDKDYITRTLVVLNKTGEIIQVKVLEESGTRNLDEAAVKAFNAAGPFPNPPKGLVGTADTIEIRWDFVLRTS